MDEAAQIDQAHGRVFAARRQLAEHLAQWMPDNRVEETMKMVLDMCAMAHGDGVEFGATRAWTAAQLKAQLEAQQD